MTYVGRGSFYHSTAQHSTAHFPQLLDIFRGFPTLYNYKIELPKIESKSVELYEEAIENMGTTGMITDE